MGELSIDAGVLGTGMVGQVRALQDRAQAGLPPEEGGPAGEETAAGTAVVVEGAEDEKGAGAAGAGAGKPADDSAQQLATLKAEEAAALAEAAKPVHGDTPDTIQKRLKDTQAAFTVKANEVKGLRKENAELKGQVTDLTSKLTAVLTNPALRAVPVPAVPASYNDRVQQIVKSYKEMPQDKEDDAIATLITGAASLGADQTRAETEHRRAVEENQRRGQQVRTEAQAAITAWVAAEDPTVPSPVFWAFVPVAETQTPPNLVGADRLAWQAQKALELAQEVIRSRDTKVLEAAKTGQAVERAAGVVMPAGGARPAGAPAVEANRLANGIPTAPRTGGESMVDQLAKFSVPARTARRPA